VENLIQAAGAYHPYFYRTAHGDEIDLVLVAAGRPKIGLEVKLSSSATVSPGFYRSCDALGVEQRFLVHGGPSDSPPYIFHGVTVAPLEHVVRTLRQQSK
jgi:hypothetical protein